ncbi:MAG: FecR domain-containing protein [Bacteroidales bacterium]|nr:FecR domain-containing protein [Bacteroidales bacterium]
MDHEKTIFLKYLDGKAGLDEKRQLLAYLKNNASAREELQSTYRNWADEHGRSFDPYPSLDRVLQKVSRKRSIPFPALVFAAAAVLAAILIIPAITKRQAPAPSAVETELYTWPESETPVALLPDGQVIQSNALEMQVSCTPGGIRIDGSDYASSAKGSCMLSIPYGHRARIQFADGSVVRMNSHSRIVFPGSFGRERNVRMTGEALFDVSRDEGRPFTVELDDVRVQVLGTRFLVSGYEDDAHRVALVSGSVNVSLGDSHAQSVTLVPNQMYTLDDNGKVNVEDVPDWRGLLDWADGVYRADGTSMKDILNYMSRYYGEKVECDSRLAGIACTGTLNLRSTLSDMLSELSGIFSIKSRRQDGVWYVTLSNE